MLSLIFLTLYFRFAAGIQPLTKLSYATYEGSVLSNGVTQWLGIRFAAAPVGTLRFEAPEDPIVENGTQTANTVRVLCLKHD